MKLSKLFILPVEEPISMVKKNGATLPIEFTRTFLIEAMAS